MYDVNIPDAHPPGTFWYHPHDTGATSLQLAQLMAGALVVLAAGRGALTVAAREVAPAVAEVDVTTADGKRAFEAQLVWGEGEGGHNALAHAS